ncbi:unnamed protein product [Closterium sp. Yama58-4]|nr:unnamed protein product [Closterium sp. Yama58-4]
MHRKPVLLSPAKEWRDPIFAAPSPSRKDTGPLTTPRHRESPLSPFRSPLMGSANPGIPAGSPLGSRSRRALASPVRDVRQADRGELGAGGGNSKRLAQLCILRTAQAQLDSAHLPRPPSSSQPSPMFSAESPSSLLCQAGSALSSSAQARASFESVQAPCSAPSGPMSAQEGAADMFDPFLLPAPAFPLRDQPSSPPALPVAQPAQAPSAEDTGATSADRGDRCEMLEPPQHADDDATAAAMAAEIAEKNVTMARDERSGENSGGQEGNGVGRIRMEGENGAQMGVMRAGKAALAEPLGTRAGAECADRENVGRIDSRGNLGGKRGDNPGACSRDAQNASVRSTLMELAANKKLPHGPRKGDPMYECKRCPLASPARSPLSHSAALTPPVHLPSRLHIPAALTGLTRGGNGGVGMGRLGLVAPGSCAMLSLSRSAQRVLRGSGASVGTALFLTRSTIQRVIPAASYSSDLYGERKGQYRPQSQGYNAGNQQRSYEKSSYGGQEYPQSSQYKRSDQQSPNQFSQYDQQPYQSRTSPGSFQRRGEQQQPPQQPPPPPAAQQQHGQEEASDEIKTIEWQSELSNSVQLIGNIAAEPALRFFDNGNSVARVKLAVGWKKANGEKRTDWYAIEMWNDVAILAQNLKKGAQVYVKGRLHMEEYTDRSGETRLDPKVDVKQICLVASKFGASSSNQSSSRGRETSPGGYNKGSYNQGGYNQGSYNQGGYNQGSYAPQETTYPEQNSYSSSQGYDNQNYGNQAGSGGQGGAMDAPVVATDANGLPRLPRFDGKLNAGQVEALWRDFFNDPVQFFDYREMKQHGEVPPKYPDFKKIATGQPLWVESRGTPPWVHDSLQKYDDAFAAALAGMPLEGQGSEEGAAGGEQFGEHYKEEFGGGAMDARGF